jgi:hypothetical protein
MAIESKDWHPITIHHVVLGFLRSERDKTRYPPWLPIVDNPDLSDPLQNHQRLRLLQIARGKFLVEIPPDTAWWEVQLAENDLDDLYLSARHNRHWDSAGSKLTQAAEVVEEPLKSAPSDWPGRIILWGA